MRSETGATLSQSNSIESDMTTASSSTFVFLFRRVLDLEEMTSSQPYSFESYIERVKRANLIRSICGKYSFVQTSSDEFAKRKQIEIAMEG